MTRCSRRHHDRRERIACADCRPRAGAGGSERRPRAGRLSAPVSTEPWIASSIERGARLAVDEINDDGGVRSWATAASSSSWSCSTTRPRPATAQANAREAVQPQRRRAAHRRHRGDVRRGRHQPGEAAGVHPVSGRRRPDRSAALPDAVPARSGRRDHDPPAGRLHRERQAEGRDADRRLRLRRAGPQVAARVVHGRRGRGRLRPDHPAPRARPRAADPRRPPRRRGPARGVGERRRRRGRGRGRPPRELGRRDPVGPDRRGPADPPAAGRESGVAGVAEVRLLADDGRGRAGAVQPVPQALRGGARRRQGRRRAGRPRRDPAAGLGDVPVRRAEAGRERAQLRRGRSARRC